MDAGFGDAITQAAVTVEYPTLLDIAARAIRTLLKETLVANKLEATATLGLVNLRLSAYDLA